MTDLTLLGFTCSLVGRWLLTSRAGEEAPAQRSGHVPHMVPGGCSHRVLPPGPCLLWAWHLHLHSPDKALGVVTGTVVAGSVLDAQVLGRHVWPGGGSEPRCFPQEGRRPVMSWDYSERGEDYCVPGP